jgi:hypothetical protein
VYAQATQVRNVCEGAVRSASFAVDNDKGSPPERMTSLMDGSARRCSIASLQRPDVAISSA